MKENNERNFAEEINEALKAGDYPTVVYLLNEMAAICLREGVNRFAEDSDTLDIIYKCALHNDASVEKAAAFMLLTFCEMGMKEIVESHPCFTQTIRKLSKSKNRLSKKIACPIILGTKKGKSSVPTDGPAPI